jgi:4-carboxymuconolactone decarboxylase
MSQLLNPVQTLSKEDLELVEHIKEKRGHIDGMYQTLLNHPSLTQHVGRLGEYLKFEGVLSDDIREIAILITARQLRTVYEWVKHLKPAKNAGVSEAVIEAIRKGDNLNSFSHLYGAVHKLVTLVLSRKEISQELQESLQKSLGVKGVIELVVLCGFYAMVAGIVFAFDVPPPPHEQEISF